MTSGDSRLLMDARRGREAAFADLYGRYRIPVFRFAFRLTGSSATAEDVTQECFLALLAGASFDPARGDLRTYLFGIVRNLALRRWRIAERECEGDEGNESDDPPSHDDPAAELILAERAELVSRAIGELPPLQKEALILFEYEDLSLEEIAAVTGADIGAVKARLHRARQALRRRLAPLLAPCAERSL
jgi:RNA polymerase sigma-70 factor (ECF subfamily)